MQRNDDDAVGKLVGGLETYFNGHLGFVNKRYLDLWMKLQFFQGNETALVQRLFFLFTWLFIGNHLMELCTSKKHINYQSAN